MEFVRTRLAKSTEGTDVDPKYKANTIYPWNNAITRMSRGIIRKARFPYTQSNTLSEGEEREGEAGSGRVKES